MGKAHFLLLLHMHQPYYFDPMQNIYRLPWVRLHGIREYLDVIHVATSHPHAKLTINLVPSLLLQLEDYTKDPSRDLFWKLTLAEPSELSATEKKFLLKNFFLANWKNMIFPMPRYRELLEKRGRDIKYVDWDVVLRRFTNQDIIDLQVLFNLAWFGFRARELYPEISNLEAKQRGFDKEDRDLVLSIQSKVLNEVIPAYKAAAQTGRIELSTTPAYHPILPLLIDNATALRSDPSTPLPQEPFRYPEDARAQILHGKDIFEQIMGITPLGMWPSEGSVCPEIIPMSADAGFEWIATDEEIIRTTWPKLLRHEAIYTPWRVEIGTSSVSMIFRDKHLSDLIGFTYARNRAESAVSHFVAELESIVSAAGEDCIIPVILDGENPWEHYEDGGRPFLNALFDALSAHDKIEMRTISQSLAERPALRSTSTIHSASWINNNFRVWIGGKEENMAWTYLSRARRVLAESEYKDSPHWQKAKEAIFAAEGSDWFWWYGDTFTSETPELFDELFRAHLSKVYSNLMLPIPDFVSVPIISKRRPNAILQIADYVHPVLDGRITGYFEWWGSAQVDLSGLSAGADGGAMAHAVSMLSALYVGFDERFMYVRIDFSEHGEEFRNQLATAEAEVEFFFLDEAHQRACKLMVVADDDGGLSLHFATGRVSNLDHVEEVVPMAGKAVLDEVLEIEFPRDLLPQSCGQSMNLAVRLLKGDDGDLSSFELARYPRHGYFVVMIPDPQFKRKNWSAI